MTGRLALAASVLLVAAGTGCTARPAPTPAPAVVVSLVADPRAVAVDAPIRFVATVEPRPDPRDVIGFEWSFSETASPDLFTDQPVAETSFKTAGVKTVEVRCLFDDHVIKGLTRVLVRSRRNGYVRHWRRTPNAPQNEQRRRMAGASVAVTSSLVGS